MDLNGQRISTGIDELDLLVEGGFRAGRSYLIVGEPGTGKTILGLQFLYKGLLNGEKSLYVAIDEQPAEVIEQAASLGWDLSPYIEKKEFLILDASGYINARAGDNQAKSDMHMIITELNNRIKQTGATRVVIDPVGPLIFSGESVARVQDQARMLFYALKNHAVTTTLVTAHSAGRSVRGIEEYLVAGTIVLELELASSRFVRTLTLEKMRSTAFEPAQYLFKIIQGRGIVMQQISE